MHLHNLELSPSLPIRVLRLPTPPRPSLKKLSLKLLLRKRSNHLVKQLLSTDPDRDTLPLRQRLQTRQ